MLAAIHDQLGFFDDRRDTKATPDAIDYRIEELRNQTVSCIVKHIDLMLETMLLLLAGMLVCILMG